MRAEFAETLERLEEDPAEVTLQDGSGEGLTLSMSRDAFAEALRVMLYYSNSARRVPLLLDRAHDGEFKPFVQQSYSSNRRIRDILAFGRLLCVTCPEDVVRITDKEGLEALDVVLKQLEDVEEEENAAFYEGESVKPSSSGERGR